jgi:hypothetical protein
LAFFTETPKMNIDNGKPLFQLSENGWYEHLVSSVFWVSNRTSHEFHAASSGETFHCIRTPNVCNNSHWMSATLIYISITFLNCNCFGMVVLTAWKLRDSFKICTFTYYHHNHHLHQIKEDEMLGHAALMEGAINA